MSDIVSIDMSKENLIEIPFTMIPIDINWLILSDNRINKVSKDIGKYEKLSRLALNDNNIDRIEPDIGRCRHMTWIDLTRNRLKSLPQEMGGLVKISGLGLSENEFEQIPDCIFKMRNLRKFGFFSNKITLISPKIKYLKALVKVDLSNNRLTEIPEEFCTLSNINWLNLSNNKLKSLPNGIGKLTRLEELGLGVNELTEIPDLSNLKKLRILPIFKNKLKSVHPSIFKLEKLEKLDLSDNFIEEFPIEILYNPTMRYLNLRNNSIRHINSYMFSSDLSNIGMIDISDNKLECIPYKFFKTFSESTIVRLSGNKYCKKPSTTPKNQSLMQICFSKIINTKHNFDDWINNMFKKHSICDQCKSVFVVEPYFAYVTSFLNPENMFVIEKMCCSIRCLRAAEKK